MGAIQLIETKNVTKSAIAKALIKSVSDTANNYQNASHGRSLKQAPEYLMVVNAAAYLTDLFPQLGFRLEMPVRELLDSRLIEKNIKNKTSLARGRFDLLLTHRRSGTPRHIVEFKRSVKLSELEKDIKRICKISSAAKIDCRLQSGFIVAISTLSKKTIEQRTQKLKSTVGKDFDVTSSDLILINDSSESRKYTKDVHAIVYSVVPNR